MRLLSGALTVCATLLALVFAPGCRKQMLDPEAVRGLVRDPYPVAPAVVAPSLRILVWPETIYPEVVEGFEKRYGVKVEVVTFPNDAGAYSKLVANPSMWDVVMVSQYMGDRMRREGLLMPVPRLNPEIYRYIDPIALNVKADPQMKYFVPFDYAVLGISFNVDYVAGFPRSWEYLAAQVHNPYLYGRVVINDDMRYALAVAMLYAGRDPANATADDVAVARDLLVRNVKDLGLRFLPDDKVADEMVSGNAILAITWSGGAAAILKARPACRFLVPEGKAITTTDGFCIPRQASHPETAALFIEYMLHPYVSCFTANRCMYASTNVRAMKHVDRFVINGPSSIMPPPAEQVHMKYISGDELKIYEDAWTAVENAKSDQSRINLIPLQ